MLCEYVIPVKSNYSIKTKSVTGVITNYEIDGNLCTIHLKNREKVIIYYYFNTKEEKQNYQNILELGMKLKVIGTFSTSNNNTIPNGFNYKNYLKHKRIYYLVQANKIIIKKNNTSILYAIKNKIIKRIDKIDKTGYFRTFLLGDKNKLNKRTLEEYQSNGISHLFSISGMHVSLIVGVIIYFLDKVSYNNFYKYGIITPILLFYLFLTNFSASIVRTVIMFIIFAINKCFNLKIKKIDLMLIVLIIAIIINPLIIFDVGFQFSYLISLSIIVMNKRIKQVKNSILKNLYLSFICFLVSLPICIYYFNKVNFLSIIFNLIIIPIVSSIIFPLTWITILMPFIYPIYEILINILETINSMLFQINLLEITFIKPNIVIILIYYIIIILSLYKKQYYLLLIIIIFFHKIYPCLDNSYLITTIDVGQGDSIFIKFSNNKGNILIDTGGKIEIPKENWEKRETKSIIETKTIPYFNSIGINKIDYLIITHGDFDHMGEAINLVNNFKVEKVIFNCGEFNDLEQDLIKILNKKKIPYYSCIKKLNIDDNKLYFLNNKVYNNENDNSSVIYTELNNNKFLFMGDAGIGVEEDLIEKYNLKNIEVLKVGHHGSKTSSSEKFIDEINPKYSIISVGKNNRYGHPNKEVLNTLQYSKIYRTDQDGSIMFKVKNNKFKIETCTP